MSNTEKSKSDILQILALAPDKSTDEIRSYLTSAGVLNDLEATGNLDLAADKLAGSKFDVVLVHNSFSHTETLGFLIKATTKNTNRAALIPLTNKEDKNSLLELVRAGAHGIVVLPVKSETFSQVITTALKSLRSSRTQVKNIFAPADETEGLPGIIETAANRLERVAGMLKEQQQYGRPVAASSKVIKESLLGAIAGAPDFDGNALYELVLHLIQNYQAPELSNVN